MMVGLHSFAKRPDNEKTLFNDVHILNKELLDKIMLINDFHMVVEKDHPKSANAGFYLRSLGKILAVVGKCCMFFKPCSSCRGFMGCL